MGIIGCPLGMIGYWVTCVMLNLANPGRRRALSPAVKRILRRAYSPAFPDVDLDHVRLRTAARFPGIPADPAGMALGQTIYLAQDTLDERNLDHMLLLLHELVHVAQYRRATRMGFACRYGFSVMLHLGNARNPLEEEAYAFTSAHQGELARAIAAGTTDG